MTAAIAFLLFFILVALGVLAAAMRSGPKEYSATETPQSRASRRAWTVFLPIVLLVAGLGIPYLVISTNAAHHEENAVGGVELTAQEARGRQMFSQNCSTCHTLHGANAVGKVGPNLDELQAVSNTAFTLDAIARGRAEGRGQMPAGLLDGRDAEDVANFVKAVSGR